MRCFSMSEISNKIGCTQFRVVQGELYSSQPVLPEIGHRFPSQTLKIHNSINTNLMILCFISMKALDVQFQRKLVLSFFKVCRGVRTCLQYGCCGVFHPKSCCLFLSLKFHLNLQSKPRVSIFIQPKSITKTSNIIILEKETNNSSQPYQF